MIHRQLLAAKMRTPGDGGGDYPTAGLVGFWPFDEGSGNTANDASGNGIHLVGSGVQWGENGIDLMGGHVEYAHHGGSPFIGDTFTLILSCRSYSADGTFLYAVGGFNGYYTTSYPNGHNLRIGQDYGAGWNFYANATRAGQEAGINFAISPTNYQNYRFIRVEYSPAELLLDADNGLFNTSTPFDTGWRSGSAAFRVGQDGAPRTYYIRNMFVYNRILSPAEIQQIHDNYFSATP